MIRAPSLLEKLRLEDRAADRFLASVTAAKWRWPRVQGVQLVHDEVVADLAGRGDGDPLDLLLALEGAAQRLARGAPSDPDSTRAAAVYRTRRTGSEL